MPMPTTRYARYVWMRERFLRRRRRWEIKRQLWAKNDLGKNYFVGYRPHLPLLDKQAPANVSSKSYNAVLLTWPIFPLPYTLNEIGPRNPPSLTSTWQPYIDMRAMNRHPRGALYRLHARRVRKCGIWARPYRRTKRERQITGANWHFWRTNGYFPDWDVLQRHPNMTDAANGEPPEVTDNGWPQPLGY